MYQSIMTVAIAMFFLLHNFVKQFKLFGSASESNVFGFVSSPFLLQASEDAKKLVNQEKSFACAEIESARAVVLRIGEALEEQEKASQASHKQVETSCLITYICL